MQECTGNGKGREGSNNVGITVGREGKGRKEEVGLEKCGPWIGLALYCSFSIPDVS